MAEIPERLKSCRFCGYSGEMALELTPHLPHYGRISCPSCDRFTGWCPKPETDKARRPSSHRELAIKHGKGFCEMCLIKEVDLPPRETLEGHHVVEYANGGTDDADNVWVVCTACHKLIHWRRTYLEHLLLKVAESLTRHQSNGDPPW